MQRNQWSKGQVRRYRLPVIAISADERKRVEEYCDRTRTSIADLVRAGLVALGVFELASLDGLPDAIAQHVQKLRGK